jgi:hypothetical protein
VVRNHPCPFGKDLQMSGLCRCIVREIGAEFRPMGPSKGLNDLSWDMAPVLEIQGYRVFAWLVEGLCGQRWSGIGCGDTAVCAGQRRACCNAG